MPTGGPAAASDSPLLLAEQHQGSPSQNNEKEVIFSPWKISQSDSLQAVTPERADLLGDSAADPFLGMAKWDQEPVLASV